MSVKIEKICDFCGKTFKVYPSREKLSSTPIRFCNKACRALFTRKSNQGNLTHDFLKSILDYCPDAGTFRWKEGYCFRGTKPGDLAGYPHHKGYWRIEIRGKDYAMHRLAWFYMTGEWPPDQIDHINRRKDDNRWCNLREESNGQNMANRPHESFLPRVKRGRASSKPRGVKLDKCGRYVANIGHPPKHLGMFTTEEEAIAAYLRAARERFGDFFKGD